MQAGVLRRGRIVAPVESLLTICWAMLKLHIRTIAWEMHLRLTRRQVCTAETSHPSSVSYSCQTYEATANSDSDIHLTNSRCTYPVLSQGFWPILSDWVIE